MEYEVVDLPIDDIMTLLKVYNAYQKSKSQPRQVGDILQTKDRFICYLDGTQHIFYSENAINILFLITGRNEPHGKLEMIKDRIVKKEEHKRETLDFIIGELNRKMNEFFESRLNF